MNEQFKEQFAGLLEKYTELLIGNSDEELKEKVEVWALYTHIAKSMPALAKHWNEMYPDAKTEMIQLISEIKQLNDKHRAVK